MAGRVGLSGSAFTGASNSSTDHEYLKHRLWTNTEPNGFSGWRVDALLTCASSRYGSPMCWAAFANAMAASCPPSASEEPASEDEVYESMMTYVTPNSSHSC